MGEWVERTLKGTYNLRASLFVLKYKYLRITYIRGEREMLRVPDFLIRWTNR